MDPDFSARAEAVPDAKQGESWRRWVGRTCAGLRARKFPNDHEIGSDRGPALLASDRANLRVTYLRREKSVNSED